MIAARIGRSTSTVSREVARNGGRRRYRAMAASTAAVERTKRPKTPKLTARPELRDVVVAKLALQWSPQQIAGWLHDNHPQDASMYVSPETIYVSLFKQLSGMEGLTRCLRTRRSLRRPHTARQTRRRGKNPNMRPIRDRPDDVKTRRVGGHWEGDLIMGRRHRRAIGTLVERTSRYPLLVDLIDGYPTERVCRRVHQRLDELPAELRRTLTWDQGMEMSGHQQFTSDSGIPVFFCDPRSPWQRPTNENTNGLLRGYFPKGQDLGHVTAADLERAEFELNNRPRRTLNWLSPAQRLNQLCALIP